MKGRKMAEITISDLDDALLVHLKRKAWEKGLPLQESLRQLIRSGLEAEDKRRGDFVPVLKPARPTLTTKLERGERRPSFHS
jgi:plasmid stability protein